MKNKKIKPLEIDTSRIFLSDLINHHTNIPEFSRKRYLLDSLGNLLERDCNSKKSKRVPDNNMSNEQQYKYRAVHPDGEIVEGWGTKREIENLRKNFQVIIDKEGSRSGSGIEELLDVAKKLTNDPNFQKGLGQFRDVKGRLNKRQGLGGLRMNEDDLEFDEDHLESVREDLSADAVTEHAKKALTVVGQGSVDIVKSTAKNTWEAVVHAGMAAMGFAVIATTGFVVKKTAKLLPGAAANVGRMINNLIENTSNQVKLITANAIDAAHAAKEHAEDASVSADDASKSADVAKTAAETVTKEEMVDGEAVWEEEQ